MGACGVPLRPPFGTCGVAWVSRAAVLQGTLPRAPLFCREQGFGRDLLDAWCSGWRTLACGTDCGVL